MYISIDSSNQLLYTGIISGSHTHIEELYADFEAIFREGNVAHKYHWSKLSRKTKKKLSTPLIGALENSKVNLNVIFHRKPPETTNKEWFLCYLPAQIAQRLERWLEGKGGQVEVVVDDDYNITGVEHGTAVFIESLLKQVGLRLTGKVVKVRHENKIKATIKQANGSILDIYASIGNKESRTTHLTDVYLGLYLMEPERFKGLKNVYYKELK